jgi:hypothetical protein
VREGPATLELNLHIRLWPHGKWERVEGLQASDAREEYDWTTQLVSFSKSIGKPFFSMALTSHTTAQTSALIDSRTEIGHM